VSRRGALFLVAVLVGWLAQPAGAHEVDPSVLTVIDSIAPSVDGVHIAVVTSVTTQLVATNDTDRVLEVLADSGEAFLRIGPDGVEANLASPTWYLTNSPLGTATVPAGVSAGDPPRWGRVSKERTWGWFDHRLHPNEVTSVLGGADTPRFTISMRWGGTELTVRGHLEQRTSRVVYASTFESLPAADTGLVVQLLQGRAPGVLLQWSGRGEVVVEGAEGEPFARLSSTGAEVNRHSGTWQFSAQAQDQDLAGVDVDPGAPPDWFLVSPSPSLAWLDERALIADDATERAWEIPLTIAGEPATIRGRSSVTEVALGAGPTAGSGSDSGGGATVAVVLVAALASTAGVICLLRRPGRSGPTGPS
jgi:hypothetical protein